MSWKPLDRLRGDARPTERLVSLMVEVMQRDRVFDDYSATRLRDTARRLLEARRAVHTGRLTEWGCRP